MQSFAILTSGGDAPGMNAAIRAAVRTGLGRGAHVFGVEHGFDGLVENEIRPMSSIDVGGIISHGGTILRSARSKSFRTKEGRDASAANLKMLGIQGLVVIGGDGSLRGARDFSEEQGVAVMGIPGSIDNDIPCTDYSIGFQTAVDTALEAIDRVRDTAYSHERVFVIEVMGRRNGFIALEAGLGGGAEAILIPELPFSLQEVCDKLRAGRSRGKRSSIIVVAEGAARAQDVCDFITNNTEDAARYLVLGHMQRGGSPNAFDRVLATRLGSAAVSKLLSGVSGEMVGVESGKVVSRALESVLCEERKIDPERLLLAEVMAQ